MPPANPRCVLCCTYVRVYSMFSKSTHTQTEKLFSPLLSSPQRLSNLPTFCWRRRGRSPERAAAPRGGTRIPTVLSGPTRARKFRGWRAARTSLASSWKEAVTVRERVLLLKTYRYGFSAGVEDDVPSESCERQTGLSSSGSRAESKRTSFENRSACTASMTSANVVFLRQQ